jgi:hypothetical protein
MFTRFAIASGRVGATLLLAGTALFGSGNASAQNAVVDLNVTLSPITILYYFSRVDVTVSSAAMANLLCGSGAASAIYNTSAANCDVGASGSLAATGSATGLTANGNIGTTPGGFNAAAVPLTLQNVWAVRAIGGATANTTVSVAIGASNTLTLNGAASAPKIVISNPTVSTTPNVSGNGTTAVTFADPGLVNAQPGNVSLVLDLTNATSPGTYETNSTGNGASNYILTVSGT